MLSLFNSLALPCPLLVLLSKVPPNTSGDRPTSNNPSASGVSTGDKYSDSWPSIWKSRPIRLTPTGERESPIKVSTGEKHEPSGPLRTSSDSPPDRASLSGVPGCRSPTSPETAQLSREVWEEEFIGTQTSLFRSTSRRLLQRRKKSFLHPSCSIKDAINSNSRLNEC